MLIADDLVTFSPFNGIVPLDETLNDQQIDDNDGNLFDDLEFSNQNSINNSMEYVRVNIDSLNLGDSDGNSISEGFENFYNELNNGIIYNISSSDIDNFIDNL